MIGEDLHPYRVQEKYCIILKDAQINAPFNRKILVIIFLLRFGWLIDQHIFHRLLNTVYQKQMPQQYPL